MFCNNCGKQLKHDKGFCPHCGTQVSNENVKTGKKSNNKSVKLLIIIAVTIIALLAAVVVALFIKLFGGEVIDAVKEIDKKEVVAEELIDQKDNAAGSEESSINPPDEVEESSEDTPEDDTYEESEQETETPSKITVDEPAEKVTVDEQGDVNSQNNEAEQQQIAVDSVEMVKSLYETVEWQENSDMIQVYYETVIGDHTLYEGMYNLGDHGFDAPVGYTSITKAYGNLDGKEYLLWSSYYGSSGYFIDRIFIIDCDTLKVVEYLEETANGRFLGGLEKKSEEELTQYIAWINEAVYAPMGISEEQRQDISLFLSNFSEVHFCPDDGAYFNEDEMIEYAYWHHHKNSLNDIVYDTYFINYVDGTNEEAQLMGFPSSKIQSTTQWYFGEKVRHHETAELFYADDHYWFFAASGEMELTFAIARDVERMDNGNLKVWFSEFSITDFSASIDGIYDLTYEQAKQKYFCKETNSGSAVLKIVDAGSEQRYNLVEFWLDGYPIS